MWFGFLRKSRIGLRVKGVDLGCRILGLGFRI